MRPRRSIRRTASVVTAVVTTLALGAPATATGASPRTTGVGLQSTTGYEVTGDWNGDDIDTVGTVAPADVSVWYLRNSNTTGVAHVTFSYGFDPS
ncbi:hypothetical protein [Micromonospora echinospora]|uniref:hypothetical protein n=1 Tax=Micromonospora echinospora TaxID=1877 RepID=UPI0036717CC2